MNDGKIIHCLMVSNLLLPTYACRYVIALDSTIGSTMKETDHFFWESQTKMKTINTRFGLVSLNSNLILDSILQ